MNIQNWIAEAKKNDSIIVLATVFVLPPLFYLYDDLNNLIRKKKLLLKEKQEKKYFIGFNFHFCDIFFCWLSYNLKREQTKKSHAK